MLSNWAPQTSQFFSKAAQTQHLSLTNAVTFVVPPRPPATLGVKTAVVQWREDTQKGLTNT